MADILPTRPDLPDDDEKEPRVVGLDSDEVDDLLAAISSETARRVLDELHDEPGAPSDVAGRVDTSIQNAQYHLDRLENAGLIESAGTAYSEKGREMTVYAPSDRALVVVAGNEDDTSGLQSALTQLLGGLGVVALGSVVVDRLVRSGAGPSLSVGSSGAGGGSEGGSGAATNLSTTEESDASAADATATPAPETATPTETQTAVETTSGGDGGGFQIAEATETPTPEATGTPAPDATGTATPAATEAPTPTPTETPGSVSTETVAEATQTVTDAARTAVETTQTAAGGGGDPLDVVASAVAGLQPGALFFLGGVVALSFVALVWRQ
ncbi:ArsR family transcriptional regulator [Halobellus sp. Atlit-38R]|uniref:ArsR/SmtB family transcription factor n=1 Tax=Halobellus sp. Atlit-38R TaxID=2282131 RepID=UPI000EF1D913|nr:winged helix-turn-helix domain-containing protein [Halobellus sp. Atlit-38R]RLM90677.1 ArsR family transcriptional regulator [Halobellus sp. Atlit-38R]